MPPRPKPIAPETVPAARRTGGSASDYTYNPATGRYRERATGRFVPAAEVRAVVDAALASSENRARSLTLALKAGSLSLDDWYAGMRREVKRANLYGAAAAAGGWDQLSAADFGRVGARIRREYAYLAEFAAKLADGRMPLDGQAVGYAAQYSQAGRATFYAVDLERQARRGQRECRNVRHALDSCDGCIAATALGWVELARMPPPGSRTCRRNCRCTLEYREGPPGA